MVRFSCYFLLTFSVYVRSYTLPGNQLNDVFGESGNGRHEQGQNYDLDNYEGENQIQKIDPLVERTDNRRKGLNVFAFDRLTNLTEKDKGPNNTTKVILINSEDHLTIYENDDDDEDGTAIQDHGRGSFDLLSSKTFLSQTEDKSLERTKRQAEEGKKKCKCRRKVRRKRVRRRRIRGRRRRGRGRRRRRGRRRGAGKRRGKRRCVCRKKGEGGGGGGGGEEEEGEGEGKDNEEPEVEEADGDEEATTTGGDDYDNEEGGDEEGEAEGEGDDDYENEEMDEDLGSEEESDEEGVEEGSDEESDEKKEIPSASVKHEVPVYVMPYPGTSGTYVGAPNTAGAPMYTTLPIPFSPYPYYTRPHATIPESMHA